MAVGQTPSRLLASLTFVLSRGIRSLTWLVCLMWQISGMCVSVDLRRVHASLQYCCCEARGVYLNVFNREIIKHLSAMFDQGPRALKEL